MPGAAPVARRGRSATCWLLAGGAWAAPVKPSPLLPLVIVGAGGHGREVLDIVEAANQQRPMYDFLGFFDDDPDGGDVLARRGITVLGPISQLALTDAMYVIGIGSPGTRRRVDALATAAGRVAATLVHPKASIGSDVHLGPGAILAAGSSITTNVRVGRHVHLNVCATVAHDCRLGDYVSLSPGAHISGDVTLGDQVVLGTGAVVVQGCNIGAAVIVGAGAAVIADVGPAATVVGVPARAIEERGL